MTKRDLYNLAKKSVGEKNRALHPKRDGRAGIKTKQHGGLEPNHRCGGKPEENCG